jgi:hypothetical protein
MPMLTLLLSLLLGFQGIPPLADQSGTITGVLKDAAGRPAPGVRVGAIPVPDSAGDLTSTSAMVSLAATDEAGKYRLENIPPGRYYVAAGRVDFPTYYPGTTALARGTVIAIAPKVVVDGIDFSMQDSSARVAGPETPNANSALNFSLGIEAKVEGGGKLPVFSPGGFLSIRLTNTSNGVRTELPISATTVAVPGPTAEFRVSIENVPAGYRVKSAVAGTTDVLTLPLKLAALTFAPGAAATSMVSTSKLSISLVSMVSTPAGIRVTGRASDTKRRSVYLSGKPGTFYSDGTFEFHGVAAGRHAIVTLDNPESLHPLGAVVVVRDRNLDGIELTDVAFLPANANSLLPEDSGVRAPGAIRLPRLSVSILEEGSREPVGPGAVYVLGPFGTSFDLPGDGRFQFAALVPGTYNLEIRVFGHATITRAVVINDQDVDLQLSTASLD